MIRTALAICFGLAIVGSANGQDGLPVAATVKIEKRLDNHEQRIAELERQNAELRASLKPVATAPPTVSTPGNVSWRSPVGHTHTCSRCGDTWDHSKNPTHNCQQCGASQYLQDVSPQLVQVRSPAIPSQPPPTGVGTESRGYTVQSYTLSGGCANGQCDSGGFGQRRGLLFRRW